MLAFSQTTGYALKALTCIADSSEVTQVRDIARCTNLPVSYLAKVINRLARAGILESKRGNKGGVWLARKPELISLLDINEAVDGQGQFTACLLGLESCSDDRDCPSHKLWKPIRQQLCNQLRNTSLADVIAFEKRKAKKGIRSALLQNPRNTSISTR